MTITFTILTLLFIIVSVTMILIILVQRPQGGGLAGAFGGAGGGGTDTVFGGRVGDALTWATVVAFVLYLLLAVTLNMVESDPTRARAKAQQAAVEETESPELPAPGGAGDQPENADGDGTLGGASDEDVFTPEPASDEPGGDAGTPEGP
jgi:preprotein translocase subunit SecG